MTRTLSIFVCFLTGLLLVSCATTPQGIPAEQLRANVTRIKIGMSESEVVPLVGKPIRMNELVDETGRKEQWIYTESQFRTRAQAFASDFAARGSGSVYEGQMILTFTNGKLTSIARRSWRGS